MGRKNPKGKTLMEGPKPFKVLSKLGGDKLHLDLLRLEIPLRRPTIMKEEQGPSLFS